MTTGPPAVVEVSDGTTTVVVDTPQPVTAVDAVVDALVEVVEVVTGAVGPAGPPGEDGTIVAVGPTPPPSPAVGDLWVDTS